MILGKVFTNYPSNLYSFNVPFECYFLFIWQVRLASLGRKEAEYLTKLPLELTIAPLKYAAVIGRKRSSPAVSLQEQQHFFFNKKGILFASKNKTQTYNMCRNERHILSKIRRVLRFALLVTSLRSCPLPIILLYKKTPDRRLLNNFKNEIYKVMEWQWYYLWGLSKVELFQVQYSEDSLAPSVVLLLAIRTSVFEFFPCYLLVALVISYTFYIIFLSYQFF